MKPVRLSAVVRDQLLREIPATSHQAQRLLTHLSDNPRSITVDLNRACSIGNLSHTARKLNPILWRYGLLIGCERPPRPVQNRFGEPSQMFLWSVLAVDEAANDGVIESLAVRS